MIGQFHNFPNCQVPEADGLYYGCNHDHFLLQPAPETFDLLNDIILLLEGQIVYQGLQDTVLEFFEYMGFRCPKRKSIANFLQ